MGAETPVAVGCSQHTGQGAAAVEVLVAAMEVARGVKGSMAAVAVGPVAAGCSRPWAQAAAAVAAGRVATAAATAEEASSPSLVRAAAGAAATQAATAAKPAAEASSHQVVQAAAGLAIRVAATAATVATREEAVSSLLWGQGVAVAVPVPRRGGREAGRPRRAPAPLPIAQPTPSSAQSLTPPTRRTASGWRPRESGSPGLRSAWMRSRAERRTRAQ